MRRLLGVGLLAVVCACSSRPPDAPSGSVAPPSVDAGTAASPGPDGGAASDGGPPVTTDGGTPADGGTAQLPAIDAYKELVVVDSSVVLDARASNASDAPWSFRRRIEQITPAGTAPATVAEGWLKSFRGTDFASRTVDDRPGASKLLASWPRAADGTLDLAQAPFRLIAISSRLDLPTSPQGEGRFIYGLVDPATGDPGLMTVAFEYALPPLGAANDRQAWAARWHALGARSFGSDYNGALQALTDAFASAKTLAQVRANEAAFGSPWELRQWKLAATGLAPAWTAMTPDQSFDGSASLAQFIVDHAADVRAGRPLDVPKEMLAGSALETGAWRFPNDARIDEPLRHAFALQTCNGCHSTETFSAQGFFHLNPLKPIAKGGDGHDRLSEFLRGTELRRRADHLAALAAGVTAEGTGAPVELPPLPAGLPRYDVVQIPAPEDGAPVALRAGRVLGNSAAKGPWLYDGSMHYFMPNDARAPVVQGFNAHNDVVGYFSSGGTRRAFVLSGGAISQPGTLGGNDSAATLVNDAGLVAGDSTDSSGTHRGFVVRGGIHEIGNLGAPETFPFAISPSGLITGQSQVAGDIYTAHAFIWSPGSGSMADLGTLGGLYSRGQTIDDSGFVTGFSTLVPSDEKVHAFTWDNGVMTDLGSAPGLPWSAVTGRNASGTMVGNIYDVPSPTAKLFEVHAFVYATGAIVDLNSLAQSPLVLHTALDTDEGGRILCTDGQVGDVNAHGLLLTPK